LSTRAPGERSRPNRCQLQRDRCHPCQVSRVTNHGKTPVIPKPAMGIIFAPDILPCGQVASPSEGVRRAALGRTFQCCTARASRAPMARSALTASTLLRCPFAAVSRAGNPVKMTIAELSEATTARASQRLSFVVERVFPGRFRRSRRSFVRVVSPCRSERPPQSPSRPKRHCSAARSKSSDFTA